MKLALGAMVLVLLVVAGIAVLPPEPAPPVYGWPVVRGSIGGDPVRWYVAFEQGEGTQLCSLEPVDGPSCGELSGLSLAALRTMPLATWSPSSTFWLSARLLGTVPPAELEHTSYVSQLIAGSRAPRQGSTFEPSVEAEMLKAITANHRSPADGGAESAPVGEQEWNLWLEAWAVEHRADEALFAAFIRHQSIGSCSQDHTPELIARLFAELALARGDRPTFIDLRIRLISNSFERVAWSSWAEARQPTGAKRLQGANVELGELFLGLVIRHPGAVGSADDWRLARAIRDAGLTAALLPRLEALATLESLDAYNRFRATEVWLHLQVYDDATQKNLETVKAAATRLNLHPIAKARVERAY